jgi:large subunit ribosomal protein L4
MVFAPKPRDYEIKVNKKERALAIKSALTTKVNENKLIVIDNLHFDEIKTKKFVAFMNNIKAQKALIVLAGKDENVEMSAHNVPGVKTALTNTINTYDILKYDTLVLTQDAVNAITEVYA